MSGMMNLPNLEAYGNPIYFLYLVVGLLPVVVALLNGKRLNWYESLIQLIFIGLMFTGSKWTQGLAMIGYVVYEFLLVKAYMAYRQKANQTPIFYGAVLLSLLPLILTKVTPLISHQPSLFGFLGISYLTFRATGMIMTARDGVIKDFKAYQFLRFLLFMPVLTSGPIDRYERFDQDYSQSLSQDAYLALLGKAVWSYFLGFFYKFVVAHYLNIYLLEVQKEALSRGGFSWALVGVMYLYGLYLFFDFAGYSLFALGTSYLFGVESPINFNKPFISKNIKDFWNRWHMSLSFWFRDFVFMRLTFTLMKAKVFKNRNTTASVAYFANMLLMGLWHGLTWYYIAYGLFHALGLIINDAWLRYKRKNKQKLPSNKATAVLAWAITMQFVFIGFLLFSGFLDTLFFHRP